jgi:AcrR family transcriptional regulator
MADDRSAAGDHRPARDRIRVAARVLFGQQGYTATTIEAVARKAGVGVSTVYAVFGNKREILADLRRQWFEEAEVESLVSEALRTSDPYRKLALCARWVRRQHETRGPIAAVIAEATRADPQAAELFADLRRKPEAKIVELVASIDGQLAGDLSADDAEAVIWALTRGGAYNELVERRGWSADRYERWLADALQYQLLGCPSRAGRIIGSIEENSS